MSAKWRILKTKLFLLFFQDPLAGCIALSAFFPEARLPPDRTKMVNRGIPVFQAHGELDNILPLHWANNTSEMLKKFLTNHQYKTYPMQHEASDREMYDLKYFLEQVVGH